MSTSGLPHPPPHFTLYCNLACNAWICRHDVVPDRSVRLPFFFTLVTGPESSLSLKLSDIRVYEPQIRARHGTPAHLCKATALPKGLELRAVPILYSSPPAANTHTATSSPQEGGGLRTSDPPSPLGHLIEPPLPPRTMHKIPGTTHENPPSSLGPIIRPPSPPWEHLETPSSPPGPPIRPPPPR